MQMKAMELELKAEMEFEGQVAWEAQFKEKELAAKTQVEVPTSVRE